MSRATTPTPTPGPHDLAPPSTPGTNISDTPTMGMQRKTPIPSTPGGHRRIASTPRTPGTSAQTCSSSPTAFTKITVHTAKCSECDKRNLETMLRCPGCTFQVCKPCRDRREQAGRSLAHGNMMTPRVATPGTGGSVVRRKPVATARSVEKKDDGKHAWKEKGKNVGEVEVLAEENGEVEEMKGKKHMVKPPPKPKAKPKPRAREATASDDSSDDFVPDPASPTSNKRRRRELTSNTEGISDVPSPFLKADDSMDLGRGKSELPEKPLSDMTTDELLAHHGVNMPERPYRAHLLSRHEPVVSDPVIEIPEAVKRGFQPRPTAEEIQKNIQDKVKEKMGLPKSSEDTDGDK